MMHSRNSTTLGFRRQASYFLKERLKGVRLAFTDVTQIQLLTEEATNPDPWGPEPRNLSKIAEAAFQVDEYDRIVDILHQRLVVTQKKSWRQIHKTFVVLEYLLTYGPERLASEFQADKEVIQKLAYFNYLDEHGIDRGGSVRVKGNKVMKLLSETKFLMEERKNARKKTLIQIQGFGIVRNDKKGTDSDVIIPAGEEEEEAAVAEVTNQPWTELGTEEICFGLPKGKKEEEKDAKRPLFTKTSGINDKAMDTDNPLSDSEASQLYMKCFSGPIFFQDTPLEEHDSFSSSENFAVTGQTKGYTYPEGQIEEVKKAGIRFSVLGAAQEINDGGKTKARPLYKKSFSSPIYFRDSSSSSSSSSLPQVEWNAFPSDECSNIGTPIAVEMEFRGGKSPPTDNANTPIIISPTSILEGGKQSENSSPETYAGKEESLPQNTSTITSIVSYTPHPKQLFPLLNPPPPPPNNCIHALAHTKADDLLEL